MEDTMATDIKWLPATETNQGRNDNITNSSTQGQTSSGTLDNKNIRTKEITDTELEHNKNNGNNGDRNGEEEGGGDWNNSEDGADNDDNKTNNNRTMSPPKLRRTNQHNGEYQKHQWKLSGDKKNSCQKFPQLSFAKKMTENAPRTEWFQLNKNAFPMNLFINIEQGFPKNQTKLENFFNIT